MIENWENTIIDYFHGMLSKQEEQELFKILEERPDLRQQFDQYAEMESVIEEDNLIQPSPGLEAGFNKMLNEEVNEKKVVKMFSPRILAYAASAVILITLGVMIGQNQFQGKLLDSQSREIVQLRNEMKSMINDQSVTNRIEAVNVSYDLPKADDKIIDILINTMVADPSSNVRLAAVEALVDMPITNQSREAIYSRLEKEEDAFVKIALIQAVVKINDKNSVYALDRVTQDEMTPQFIKEEAEIAQLKLTKT